MFLVSALLGAALTIVNSLGFASTVPASETLNRLAVVGPADRIFVALAVGPIVASGSSRCVATSRPYGRRRRPCAVRDRGAGYLSLQPGAAAWQNSTMETRYVHVRRAFRPGLTAS